MNHEFILAKLKEYHLPENILNMIRQLIKGNQARVTFGSTLSNNIDFKSGVPQGIPMSSLIFCAVSEHFLGFIQKDEKNQGILCAGRRDERLK